MSVLMRACPFCGAAYGEHSLDALARCVEEALGDEEAVQRPSLAVVRPSG